MSVVVQGKDRVSPRLARADAVKAGRASGHRRLGLHSIEHDGMLVASDRNRVSDAWTDIAHRRPYASRPLIAESTTTPDDLTSNRQHRPLPAKA